MQQNIMGRIFLLYLLALISSWPGSCADWLQFRNPVIFRASASSSQNQGDINEKAELVLLNARVITVDQKFTIASAVAIKDGRFAAVGSDREVRSWIGQQTRVIDCRGKTVIPGLIDSHVHATGVANNESSQQPYVELNSISAIQDWIRKAARTVPEGQWIIVPRSYPTRLKERRFPTRAELDQASDRHPILFDAAYCQVLNSLGLRRANIDRNSPPLKVGEIVRDEKGEPTGLLRNARGYLARFLPGAESSREARLANLEKVHSRYHSVGITSVIERGASLDDYRLYEELYRQGRLRTRTRVTIRLAGTSAEEAEKFLEELPLRPGQGDDWLAVGPLKITVDGGILIGTAYMREPYGATAVSLFNLSDPQYRGSLSLSLEGITDLLRAGHRAGWQMVAHVTGDAGVDLVLKALETIDQELPVKERRFNLLHAYFPNQSAIEKARQLGVCLDTQPAWFYKDADALWPALGPQRMQNFIGVADYQRGGVVVAANTDHMLGTDPNGALNPFNPFLTMYVLVTRKTESGRILGEKQRVSRQDALRMMTINAAYLSFDEKKKGSIEAGKLADLAILSDDYLSCPAERIKDIKVITTMAGGKVIFDRK